MDRKGKGQPITSWTIHMIFRDFLGKRAGLIKALTTDYEKFRQQCDPQEPYMCLYGCPDETWELKEPPDVPHELPEPNIGINFARDGMPEKEWLAHIAIHSDAWLYSYAFYIAIRAALALMPRPVLFLMEVYRYRMRLFDMINFNPTICEIVRGTANTRRANEKPPGSSSKKVYDDTNIMCGVCGVRFSDGDHWIFCGVCTTWYHGRCVAVTPEQLKSIKQYRCPSCCSYE